jgi:hypothetical protein
MNIHQQQPFYQEDFSNYNNNYYYDQNQVPQLSSPVPNYHPTNGHYSHSPTDEHYIPPTYWSPDDDEEKSLSSNPSSVEGALGQIYGTNGLSPESVVHNHIHNEISSSCLAVNVTVSGVSGGNKKKSKGQTTCVGVGGVSKRKGVGGRRKSEKPPAPVVLKKRRLAANARYNLFSTFSTEKFTLFS